MTVEPSGSGAATAFDALERGVYAALETYSNVHRGSGHHSLASTYLFEKARGIVLEHLGLSAARYVVIFGTPRTADTLAARLKPGRCVTASSRDIGLPLGVRALAVERSALPLGLDVIQEEERALTARALLGLTRVPGLKVYGIADPESPAFANKGGVIPFDLKSVVSHTVARRLAARGGIGVRSGCHCAHLTVKRMLGVPPWAERPQRLILTVLRRFELPGVVRVSLGIGNSDEDVDTLIRVLDGIARLPKGGPSERVIRQQIDGSCKATAERVYGP